MKKNVMTVAALLATAVGFRLSALAVGDTGDICSLQAVPVAAYGEEGNVSSPLGVGETFYIRVRLLNENWVEAKNATPPAIHKWMLERNGTQMPSDWQDVVNWPALRIAIGAKKVNALYSPTGPNGETSDLNPDNAFYTDFYFSYTVKEGELGQPVKLVNGADKIIDEASGIGGAGLYFVNVNTAERAGGYWDLKNDIVGGHLASFKYSGPLASMSPSPLSQGEGWGYPPDDVGERQNIDKIYPGVFVKTIDFDSEYAEADRSVWRYVYQGLSDVVAKKPLVTGVGPTTVYVWSDDESVVVPEGEVDSSVTGRTVVKVTLKADGEGVEIRLKGKDDAAVGATANICLCSQNTPAKNALGDVLAGSYLSVPVKIRTAPEPFMSITDADGAQGCETVATATNEPLQMKLSFSKAFEESDVEVKLNPTVGETGIDAIAEKYVVILRDESDSPMDLTSVTSITVPKGQKEVYFWLYALGSCKELSGDKLTLSPSVDATSPAYGFFQTSTEQKLHRPAFVKVTDQKPLMTVGAPTSAYQGDEIEVDVVVEDNWRDLTEHNTNGYAVTVAFDGKALLTTNGCSFANDTYENSFAVTVPDDADPYAEHKLSVTLWDGTHVRKNDGTVWERAIAINKKPEYNAYPRFYLNDRSDAPVDTRSVFCEGEAPFLRFAVTNAALVKMYAKLVPQDAVSTGLVEAAALDREFVVERGSTLTDGLALKLLDGDALSVSETVGKFTLALYDFESRKRVDTYMLHPFTFTVTNAAPTVEGVRKGDWGDYEGKVKQVGGEWVYDDSRVPSGVPVAFTVKLSDLGVIDATSATTRVRYEWTDGPEGDKWSDRNTVTVNTNGIATLTMAFSEPESEQTISIFVMDRDQKAASTDPNEFGDRPAFSFRLKLSKMPNVYISFPSGSSGGSFRESTDYSKAKNNPAFYVKLSEFPKGSDAYEDPVTHVVDPRITSLNKLVVRLTVGEFDDNGRVELSTNYVYFGSTTDINKGMPVYFDKFTQNGGSKPSSAVIRAEVVTGNTDLGYEVCRNKNGDPWCNYFAPSETPIYLWNDSPTQMRLESGNASTVFRQYGTNTWTAGESVTLKWTVSDTAYDLTNGFFTVNWDGITDDHARSFVTLTNGWPITLSAGSPLKATAKGELTFRVPNESTEVTVTADDGEDGQYMTRFWIKIVPTKKIAVSPFGPAPTTQTKYDVATGRGRGHVYVDGSTGSYIVRQFIQTWEYNESAKQADLYALGYAAATNAVPDNGALGSANGFVGAALSPDGYKGSAGNYYDAGSSEYDSFFYRWAEIGGEGGEATYLPVNPTKKPAELANHRFALDNEKNENGENYGTVQVEAIFSRELHPSDNMGDINSDGIPDLYAKLYKFVDADGGNDLDDQDDRNDDSDFLPAMETSPYGALIPGLKGTWVDLGTPFDAKFELRGYHEGLNDAMEQIGLEGVKSDRVYEVDDGTGKKVYDETKCTISRLEYEAWKDSGLPADKWSPERPTDPTKEDTDKDGLPDGYEYYFWYKAHVGYIDADGKHRYMTGRRYNPAHPCEPDFIASGVIEGLMDPRDPGDKTTVNTRDTDNDGLPDLLEFELGTNPFDYDTDGDGLPDGYEVLIGTDPLDANGYADTKGNPDGDAMAYEYLEDKYEVYGLLTDSGELVYRAIKKLPFGAEFYEPVTASVTDGDPFMTPGWWLVTAEGGRTNAFFTTVDMTGKWRKEVVAGGTVESTNFVLCADLEKNATRALRKVGDEYYLGLPAYLPRGTVFSVQPSNVVDGVKTQRLAMIRDDGSEVGSGDFLFKDGVPPNRFYSAFRYGMTGLDKGEKPVWGRFAVCGDAEIKGSWPVVYVYGEEVEKSPVYLIHHISYQESGFDPRAAWSASQTKSRAFATYDEFLALAFHWHVNARGFADGLLANSIDGIVPSRVRPWSAIWQELCTDPNSADSDNDGMPDGWELYVMAGPRTKLPKPDDKIPVYAAPHPTSAYGPLNDYGLVGDKAKPDSDNLDFLEEFCGVDSVAAYEGVATIVDVHPEWRNKKWPTDPWNADTDGDGLTDGEEGQAFIYGDPAATGAAGGGLNPLSWDTDGDGLPDPWELEFQGSYTEGASQVEHSTTVTQGADGNPETNSTTRVLHEGGSWSGGMDGTVNDANADYDFDGLLNWQEYMVGSMRCWRYDDTFSSWSLQHFDEGEFDALDPRGNPEGFGRYWYERIVCIPARDKLMGPLPCPPAQGVITENPARGSFEYNPRFVNSIFDAGAAYFSLCTNEWDTAHNGWYMFKDGIYHDLKNPGPEWSFGEGPTKMQLNRYSWWVFLRESMPPFPFVYMQSNKQAFIYPKKYICCDPTKADTDNDGMDDYYELFHGLNPLLGKSAGYDNGHKPAVDIVFEAYGGGATVMADTGEAVGYWSAENNFWLNAVNPQNDSDTGATLVRRPVSKNGAARDFVAYPWLGGLADADPDGDDIRNQEEAIMPNLQASSSWHHTDPTPLWMTDLSYAKSLTYRYYRPVSAVGWLIGVPSPYFTFDWNGDGLIDFKEERFDFRSFPGYDWNEKTGLTIIPYVLHGAWGPIGTIYSFEENEGYDSDHDYLSDFEEAQGKTKPASDPQVSDDPLRRQAMWFDGRTSFLETPLEESEYSPVDSLPIPPELPFLYFTAECWARPDDACDLTKPQTVLERAVWNSPANPGDMNYMRKNFLLGIRNGRWYAKFDSSGTGAKYDSVEITDGPVAEKKWTHLAATYDGTSFKLYMNGVLQVEKLTSITPEHGTWTVTADEAGALRDGKTTHPDIALLVGASAKTRLGIIFDSLYRGESTFGTKDADYQDFYNGWVDEVRVWDGARTTAQLLADYRKRYSQAECAANRDEVLAAWLQGANFTDNSPTKRPPELRYHYSFDHLPGAVRAADVIPVPAGFNTEPGVVDAKAKHWSRPDDWSSPWWESVDTSLRSTVYAKKRDDRAWVPWIGNTVAHLPRPDGTTVDSVYWSENYAGAQAAVDLGYKAFGFPRTAEYVSKWTQMSYDRLHQPPITTPTRYDLVNALSETDDGAALLLYSFTLRHRTRTGADLLPFGGAFPKRISLKEGGMWDDKGPADAWAETGIDADNNGIPDWWQAVARATYCRTTLKPTDSLGWDTPALYNGITMPAWQAYLRDLARGMLPGGRVDPDYADTRDVDGDNMPDWWEDLIGVQTFSKADATADPDHDGLSNYQEYLVTERDGLYPLNPRLSHSGPGQEVTDYFLRVPQGKAAAGQYLGEAYADHDFMEDYEEDAMGTDRTKYDAYSDLDEDGWSAFSELRYSTFKMGIASRFLSHMFGASEMKDYPVPVVHATLRYNGTKTLAGSNATIVVEAYSGNNLQKAPNAYYSVRPGQAQTRRIFIGPYEDRVVHGTLTPGHVQAGLDQIRLIYAHVQPDDLWSWNVSGTNYKGTYAEMIAAYRLNGTNVTVAAESFGNFDTGIVNANEGGRQWLQISVDDATQKGHLLLDHERAGDIDLVTGDFSLDLSKIGGLFMNESGVSTEQYFYGIEYSSVLPTMQTKALKVSLAEPDAGSLTEGTTAFVAYMDLDGDGYTPSVDPIGFARDVAIGWDQVPELTIEMTDGSQACGSAFGYADDVDMLRVVRTSVNGSGAGVKHRIVFSRNHELATTTARHNVYDGDYLTTGAFGLDWANLASDLALMEGVSESDVTQVGYTVVRGKGSIVDIPEQSVVTNFTVAYSAARTAPVPYSPSASAAPIVETQRPTFKWSLPEGYTAFRLQISDAAGKQVYLSDLQKMPPRDASSRYFWTPPVYIGKVVSTNDSWQIANNSNYNWRVAVYNPKFRTTEWSESAAFKTQLAEKNGFSTSFGSADVSVRYFGPATNELKDVIVQLYRNADFTGAPAAQTRLFDLSGELISLTNGQTVSFHGLESGDYYACAFIDRNGDNTRQRYETWGYSANVGRGVAAIWTPVAVTVDARDAKVETAEVYLEDTDINQNDAPDCLDGEDILKSADTEVETTTATDTDGDGMPDKWEEESGLNPYDPGDAENAIDGDVMAFFDLNVCLVHVGKPDGSESAWYALPDYAAEPARLAGGLFQPQLPATNLHFVVTTWKNGNYYGLGTNVTFKAADGLVVLDSKLGTLRLVHAQVYAKKGFNPKTAVPLEDAVDTKPFTALDKYLVGAYFDAIGVPAYKDRHLDSNDMDSDGDGIPDGWELYVMYGKTWGELLCGATAAESASITPFDRADAMKKAPATGSQLRLCEEYDAGCLPTDPWHLDTDGDGVSDFHAYRYRLKGDESGKDLDGDGLPNYTEYLITEVFKYAQLDPANPKSDGACVDYFRKVGDLYLGEIFTDHDQIDDVWEGESPAFANRYVYDPSRDDDGDGWSNYAEFRAGTDPSRVADLSIENSEIAEYPQPMIIARISGAEDCVGKVIVEAYPTNKPGRAAATWEMSTAKDQETNSTNANEKVLGSWRVGTKQCTLSPSSIQPGSVLISAKDLGFKYYDSEWNDDYYYYGYTALGDIRWSQGAASEAKWIEVIHDVMREGDNQMGDLVYTGGKEKQTVGWVNYETGLMEIDFSLVVDKVLKTEKVLQTSASTTESGNMTSTILAADSFYHNTLTDMCNSYFKVNYISQFVSQGTSQRFYLTEAKTGHVTEGLNTFVVYVDEDGNGVFTPGEPYGVVSGVDVGWQGAKFEVTLSRTAAAFARLDLFAGLDDRQTVFGADSGDVDGGTVTEDARMAWEKADPARESEHVRIIPYQVRGTFQDGDTGGNNGYVFMDEIVPARVVAELDVNQKYKPAITEGDFLNNSVFDIDGDLFRSKTMEAVGGKVGDITGVRYCLILGNSGPLSVKDVGTEDVKIRAFQTLVERRYEPTTSRTRPSALETDAILHAARPVFKWRLDEPTASNLYALPSGKYGCSYTAFQLQVVDAADTTKVVYDSGVLRAPVRDAEGRFVWEAPVCAGDQTNPKANVCSLFAAAGNWKWRVAMYNAKFKPVAFELANGWSEYAAFSTSVGTQQETDDSGFSSIDVSVKYTGPAEVLAKSGDLAVAEGKVRIQAFTTADFSGEPVAQGFVANKTKLTDVADITANGRLIGLKPGTYFVRAYIDSNGNFKKDPWESWGQAKGEVVVKRNQLAPIVGLYIEDADTDGDWVPDAYEYLHPEKYEIGRSDASVDPEKRIILKKEIYDGIIAGTAGISRFLSGATLKFFENFDATSLLLGLGGTTEKSTIDAIRKAVEKNIDPNSVKITSFTVDATNGKVWLTVGAKAADSIAGQLLSPVYELPTSTTVTIKVYGKANLATDDWTPVAEVTKTITSTVDERIPVDTGVDFNSGFYKVEIVQ